MYSYCLILVVIIGCILTAGFLRRWSGDIHGSVIVMWACIWRWPVYVVRRLLTPSPWLTVRVEYLESSGDWSADRLDPFNCRDISASQLFSRLCFFMSNNRYLQERLRERYFQLAEYEFVISVCFSLCIGYFVFVLQWDWVIQFFESTECELFGVSNSLLLLLLFFVVHCCTVNILHGFFSSKKNLISVSLLYSYTFWYPINSNR